MPRYKLRTLLILLAVVPPMVAGGWQSTNTLLNKTSERRADPVGFFAPTHGGPKQTVVVLRCECGMTFSQSVQNESQKAQTWHR
jgi:hypothetical protein